MRNFIKYTFVLILLILGIITGLHFITNSLINTKATFTIKNSPKYLFIGHSHSECAYNDTIIPNSKNISRSGEAYFYNYIKLRKVIIENPSIETVFVEFTNNQINKRMDEWIWDDEYLFHQYSLYSPFIRKSDNSIIFNNNKAGYFLAFSSALRKQLFTVLNNDYNYTPKIGGYRYLFRDKTDSLLLNTTNIDLKTLDTNNFEFSLTNLNYLDSIVKFCRQNNKDVVLMRTPMHSKSTNLINEIKYKELLENRIKEVDYMDLMNFPLKNNDFGDLEHLNYKGATKVSKWFASLIKEGLLECENKQDFINQNLINKTSHY